MSLEPKALDNRMRVNVLLQRVVPTSLPRQQCLLSRGCRTGSVLRCGMPFKVLRHRALRIPVTAPRSSGLSCNRAPNAADAPRPSGLCASRKSVNPRAAMA